MKMVIRRETKKSSKLTLLILRTIADQQSPTVKHCSTTEVHHSFNLIFYYPPFNVNNDLYLYTWSITFAKINSIILWFRKKCFTAAAAASDNYLVGPPCA